MNFLKKWKLILISIVGMITLTGSQADAYVGTVTIVKRNETAISFSGDSSGYNILSYSADSLKAKTKTQGDFNLSNKFSIEIDGVLSGGIHSVSGSQNVDIVEYKDGEDGVIHTRPGNNNPGQMTITKDWSNTSEWLIWRKAVLNGKVERKSVSVIFHNDAGEEAGRMNAIECSPISYSVLTDPINSKTAKEEVLTLECTKMTAKGINSPNL
jgi:phage tail-like protein